MADYAKDHAPPIEHADVDAWLADVMADQDLPAEIGLEMRLTCSGATVGLDRELLRRGARPFGGEEDRRAT